MTEAAHATPRSSRAARAFPVVELFGPTVQGEGPDAGSPAYFVRFGGCDYRCRWCDSMYAVQPALVRADARRLTGEEIATELHTLGDGPELVVLTGGNPALLQLGDLVARLQADGLRVAVETQGSVWRDWLGSVDRLVVSPKGPSSGMDLPAHRRQVAAFLAAAMVNPSLALKIVLFDDEDLEWARGLAASHPTIPLFLSAGTDVDLPSGDTLARLSQRYRWLCESVARLPDLARCRVLPQLHVVAWGTARGV